MRSLLLVTIATTITIGAARHSTDQRRVSSADRSATIDVSALLAAARGAPPLLCQLAARTVQETDDWRDTHDAPFMPVTGASDGRGWSVRPLSRRDLDAALSAMASDDPCVRELGARITSRQDDSLIIGPMLRQLAAADSGQRALALAVLGSSTPPGAMKAVRAAMRDVAMPVRANAAWAAGRLEDGAAVEPLMGLTRDPASLVRRSAVEALGRLDSSRALAALANVLLHDADTSVRRTSAWAIGQVGDAAGASALSRRLANDPDDRVREMAAWALGRIESPNGAPALDHALASDVSTMVRATAAWALGTVGGSAATPGLLRGLSDANADVRLRVAWALSRIADPAAAPALTAALEADADPVVQRAMLRAVVKSGGANERVLRRLASSNDPKLRETAIRVLAGRTWIDPWPWPQPRPRPSR